MFDFLFILKWLGAFITFPTISFLVNFFYMRSKDRIQYIEKLSFELKLDNIDYHVIEVLFRKIYRSRYVSAEEVIILMSQKNPSRLSFLYAQLNNWLKITEIKNDNGDIIFDFSYELRTKKLRGLWGCGLLASGLLLDVFFIFSLNNVIDFIYYHKIYSHYDSVISLISLVAIPPIFYFLVYFVSCGISILLAPPRVKKIKHIISLR